EYEYLGPGGRTVQNSVIKCDDPIGCRLSHSGHPLIIHDAQNYEDSSLPLTDQMRQRAEKFGIRSQINYPIFIKGEFRGSLCIYQTDRTRLWTEDEVSLVEALAERFDIRLAEA